MSDVAVELAPSPPTGLMGWLRFDQSRVPEVEAAYDAFIRSARPGVIAGVALLALLVAPLAGVAIFYIGLLVAILRCPADVRETIIVGCVDVKRACTFAALVAIVIAILEALVALAVTPRYGGIPRIPAIWYSFSLVWIAAAVFLAPVAEELFVQGWFQSRVRNLGGAGSALLATVFFVAIHFPKTPYDFIRAGNLGFAGYLRSTTRSLGACIVAHACNNAVAFIVFPIVLRLARHAVP
ncbi:MAG TPA: CPBP family intramembrane glutamic endopeptidase [Candidatus Acidoferrum sp.]|nr:CPBP family intramembrane glutamic endopeptidase [Candidatus Acidoferrum sp.]